MTNVAPPQGTVSEWTRALRDVDRAALIGSATTGQIWSSNGKLEAMTGRELAPTLCGLCEQGIMSKSDFDTIRSALSSPNSSDAATTATISLRTSSGAAKPSKVMAADFIGLGGHRTFFITAEWRESRPNPARPPLEPITFSEPLILVCDQNLVITGVDRGLQEIGVDIEAQLGTQALATIHPLDLPKIMPGVRSLIAGKSDRIDFTTRVSAPGGTWGSVHLRVDRLLGLSPTFLFSIRPVLQRRKQIDTATLTARETAVISGIFEGMRTMKIAERDGVSEKTVRNQLSGAYRKLGVSGLGELLRDFDAPLTAARSAR